MELKARSSWQSTNRTLLILSVPVVDFQFRVCMSKYPDLSLFFDEISINFTIENLFYHSFCLPEEVFVFPKWKSIALKLENLRSQKNTISMLIQKSFKNRFTEIGDNEINEFMLKLFKTPKIFKRFRLKSFLIHFLYPNYFLFTSLNLLFLHYTEEIFIFNYMYWFCPWSWSHPLFMNSKSYTGSNLLHWKILLVSTFLAIAVLSCDNTSDSSLKRYWQGYPWFLLPVVSNSSRHELRYFGRNF